MHGAHSAALRASLEIQSFLERKPAKSPKDWAPLYGLKQEMKRYPRIEREPLDSRETEAAPTRQALRASGCFPRAGHVLDCDHDAHDSGPPARLWLIFAGRRSPLAFHCATRRHRISLAIARMKSVWPHG